MLVGTASLFCSKRKTAHLVDRRVCASSEVGRWVNPGGVIELPLVYQFLCLVTRSNLSRNSTGSRFLRGTMDRSICK